MTDYRKWDRFQEESSDEEPQATREVRSVYYFSTSREKDNKLDRLLALREDFLQNNPPKESKRDDPLQDFVNFDDQDSPVYVNDKKIGTKHFRYDAQDLHPKIEINPIMIDYSRRTLLKSNEFKVEHIIDISYFLSAYKSCEPKPDRNAVRTVANGPSNVVRAASWVDDLKDGGAQFNTLAGAYMASNMDNVAETLRNVSALLGPTFLNLLLEEIKKSLKIELSFDAETQNMYMYVNHDLECFLQEMMLFATVPVFEVKSFPCCKEKFFHTSIDDYSLTKWRSCKKSQRDAVNAIRAQSMALAKTYLDFKIGEINNVLTEKITVEMYQANLEATDYQDLLSSVRQLLSQK